MKLTCCVGLPASGKSTWARIQAIKHPLTVFVEKDAIRRCLKSTGWVWSQENEKDVLQQRDDQIEGFLSMGYDVISADTNLARKHRVRLEELAKKYGAEFVVKKFTTSVEECIRRDSLREAKVGEDVIRKMAKQYHVEQSYEDLEPVVPDANLLSAIICDLDGTLCLNKGHRSYYDASKCAEDALNAPVRKVIEVFYRFMDYRILYVSGREERFRPQTEEFFLRHHLPPGPLWMRKDKDYRKDYIVKYDIFNREIRGKYNIQFVFDDRLQVLRLWQAIGLTTFAVGNLEEF